MMEWMLMKLNNTTEIGKNYYKHNIQKKEVMDNFDNLYIFWTNGNPILNPLRLFCSYNEDSAGLARWGQGGEEMSDEIEQQTLLPGVKDPNLWMVKCLQGMEKQTVLRYMRKAIF